MTREGVLEFLERQANYDLGYHLDEESYFREAISIINNSVPIDRVLEIIDEEYEKVPVKAKFLRPLLCQDNPDLDGALWACSDIKERVASLKGGDKE